MTIDHAGTGPGLVAEVKPDPEINLKCKKNGCASIVAYEIKLGNNTGGQRVYRCKECGTVSSVNVGGNIDI